MLDRLRKLKIDDEKKKIKKKKVRTNVETKLVRDLWSIIMMIRDGISFNIQRIKSSQLSPWELLPFQILWRWWTMSLCLLLYLFICALSLLHLLLLLCKATPKKQTDFFPLYRWVTVRPLIYRSAVTAPAKFGCARLGLL